MPKLNGILMVVLAAAVLAATGLLVLRSSTGPEDSAVRAEKLLRRLADADVDVRREGEDGLRRMGPEAVGPLRLASRSSDRVLAGRATKLLGEVLPPTPGTSLEPSPDLEFRFLCSGLPEHPDRSGTYSVEVTNRAKDPVVLALSSDGVWSPAWFEIGDDRGGVRKVPVLPVGQPVGEGLVILEPGAPQLLFLADLPLMHLFAAPEARTIRFVYDASTEEYRARAGRSSRGSLLRPALHASRSLSLNDAR